MPCTSLSPLALSVALGFAACADSRAPGTTAQPHAPRAAAPSARESKSLPTATKVSRETRAAEVAPPSAARAPTAEERSRYTWLPEDAPIRSLADAIAPPPGFARVELPARSFGAFLRGLPLRPAGTPVRAFDGDVLLEANDPRISAVVLLDVGTRDLQQCADTAIRLHAEWLWSRGDQGEIGYHFTSGDLATWARHQAGDRPIVDAKRVTWSRSARASSGRPAFRAWLDLVFSYAGTVSVAREAAKIDQLEVRPGDFFVLPGGPGHAVIVLDVARSPEGRRVALLGQGFMPAQDAHVLASRRGSAWFDLEASDVDTPFWPAPFPWSSLRRMRTASGRSE